MNLAEMCPKANDKAADNRVNDPSFCGCFTTSTRRNNLFFVAQTYRRLNVRAPLVICYEFIYALNNMFHHCI